MLIRYKDILPETVLKIIRKAFWLGGSGLRGRMSNAESYANARLASARPAPSAYQIFELKCVAKLKQTARALRHQTVAKKKVDANSEAMLQFDKRWAH